MDFYSAHDGKRVCFIYNFKCTAACSHCITESSPQRTGKLSVEETRRSLEVARERGMTMAIFSGGEVFLHFDELLELISYAKELGFTTMVETNAYWATNDDVAEAKIRKLLDRGLDTIHTSADIFRDPWVPLDRIVRFGKAAEKLGVPYDICFLYSGNDQRDAEILERLESERLNHSKDRLFPFGNAADLPPSAFVYEDLSEAGDCGDLQPTVAPNGDFVACCNINIHLKGSPLHLGNIREEPYDELVARFESDEIIRTIRKSGFRYFVEALRSEGGAWSDFGEHGHATICHLCHDLFRDPDKVAFFRRKIAHQEGRERPELSKPDRLRVVE